MIYLLPITFLFLYLYIESQVRHQLEFKMIRYINESTQLYQRGQYYEKQSYVLEQLFKEVHPIIRIFINEHKLERMYRKLLLLYPTSPYIL